MLEHAITAVSIEDAAARFRADNEFLFLDQFLPADRFAAELAPLSDVVRRNDLPWVARGGVVTYPILLERAPGLVELYRSERFIEFLSSVVGRPLSTRPEGEEHSCAVYWYTRPGDGMEYHYDVCGAAPTSSYTVVIGLVDDSSQRLRCELFRDEPDRGSVRRDLTTGPGSLVMFCGSKVYHGVTALGAGEQRAVLSMRYVAEPVRVDWRQRVRNALARRGVTSNEFASVKAMGSIVTVHPPWGTMSAGIILRKRRLPYVFLRAGRVTISVPPRRFAGPSAID